MAHVSGEIQLKAFMAATRRLIDPNRAVFAASTPYILSSSIGRVSRDQIVATGIAADRADADLIHLEFEPGREADGPTNVMVAAGRSGTMIFFTTCRFWCDPRGRPFLIASAEGKKATMSFDPDGMDSYPGAPALDLRKGYARAERRLRELYSTAIAANDFGNSHVVTGMAA